LKLRVSLCLRAVKTLKPNHAAQPRRMRKRIRKNQPGRKVLVWVLGGWGDEREMTTGMA